MMTVDEEQAFIATSLGFPPYKRSYLPSKTYQAFFRFFPLSDQQSFQISLPPPRQSGTNAQDKEENFLNNKKNCLVENEAEDGIENEQPNDGSMSVLASNQIVGRAEIEDKLLKEIPPPPESGTNAQDKEENSLSNTNKNCLVENEAEDRIENEQPNDGGMAALDSDQIVGRADVEDKLLKETIGGQLTDNDEKNVVGNGESGGVQENKDVDNADLEEGEISDGKMETNLSNDQVVGDSVEVDDRNHEEQPIQKDKQVEQEGRHEKGLSIVGKGTSRDNLSPSPKMEKRNVLGRRGTCMVKEIDAFDLMRDTGVQKKRVLTAERKAKKKASKRRKRAEEDRKSGVKRLKLQPNLKPKKVVHCKYYINGKCQQGDACKFSHDITPLTKSKPCIFFAQHQCLKGKDCPYDHDLFKYPCDNFKAKGFCSRGDTCLFSHKIPLANDSPASDCKDIAADTTPKTPSALKTINRFPGKSVVEMETPSQAPKGISFLSFGKAAFETPSKQQKCDLPAMGDAGGTVGSKNQGALDKFNNSNEKSGKTLVTTQSLSQPPKRTTGGQNKIISNPVPREPALASQFASKWGNLTADTVKEAPATPGPVAGVQNKNILNSAPREPSPTPEFRSKWANPMENMAHGAPVTAELVAASKIEPTMTGRSAVQSAAPSFTTVSSILQEFLFNGQ